MTAPTVYDDRPCALGEGPLWHPVRGQLFWFDILGKRLLSRAGDAPLEWQFDEYVSAAGWVDVETLLIASETSLSTFDIASGETQFVTALEADDDTTRSNDGRADPWGGFWIGTMSKTQDPGKGAIYRYIDGQLTRLFDGITISNAIAFAPDRSFASYTDTPTRQVLRQTLDAEGWPTGAPTVWVDLRADARNPDGAVIDAAGNLWLAEWGSAHVACYDPSGVLMQTVPVGGAQSSCPAFGGPDLATLFVTTAAHGLTSAGEGFTYTASPVGPGQSEHQVRL